MTSGPLVSVLINNYNYARFLGEAIESVLAQTYSNLEVIVVDDGSTDDSRKIIAGYGDRIIPVLQQNGGQAAAFNAGFAASKGEILFFLDSDDMFLAEKVSRIVQTYLDNPHISWCFDRVHEYDSTTGKRYPPPLDCEIGAWDLRAMIAAGKPPFIPTATSGLSFRRSILTLILPMPDIIRITSDGYLKVAALGLAEGWMSSEELSLQRIHDNNAYTHRRTGRQHIMGLTGLLTGLSLYERFPMLRRLATTLFARGLGMCWVAGGPSSDYEPFAKSFLQTVPFGTKAAILFSAASTSARQLLSRS